MVQTDWDKIFSVDVSSLTDDEIEYLCPTIIQCNVDEVTNIYNLQTLMKLSQEMLQYKDNQVESLLLECSELKETLSSLKSETTKSKNKEVIARDIKHPSDVIDTVGYQKTLKEKSDKIETLMAELESLDRENTVLKNRLVILKDEMEDATERMNEMTEELSSSQVKIVEYKAKVIELERENTALGAQIEELTSQQIDRDKAIDEFGVAIDSRISEWKIILDEKDAEIAHLKETLSQSAIQSARSIKEQDKSQIAHLNNEIRQRDTVITELQNKLSEAIAEINESATLIEKLRANAKKNGKAEKRKEQKDLLKKIQDANHQIFNLQNALDQTQEELKSKSSELCEVLSTLRRYEDENHGLTDALCEIKALKSDLNRKREYIEDLVNMVNKLEMLNSYQEMEIITLREKLGIPEDESISIQNTLVKRKEQEKKIQEIIQQNKALVDENLEMKSTIRMLKYKLNLTAKKLDFSNDEIDASTEFLHSTKLPLVESEFNRVTDFEHIQRYYKIEDELRKDMQLVIEENEALRTGMHEILDSIRNQDAKSTVEVQSSTLERLLEALDVRHLAGWYHPAMRLQEHLNVIQGTNAELRCQLKQIRKELDRKDAVLQELALSKGIDGEKFHVDDSESDTVAMYLSKIKNLENTYQNEMQEWEKLKSSLMQENAQLKNSVDSLKLQLDIYEKNLQVFETGDDEIRKAFVTKTKEHVETATELFNAKKKVELLQELLDKECAKSYEYEKESVQKESALEKVLTDANKRNKILECELNRLQSNLSNSISILEYNELKEKYEELSIRYHSLLEKETLTKDTQNIESLEAELELMKQEKRQLIEQLEKEISDKCEHMVAEQLKEAETKELMERQRADHMTKLHEISQAQLSKCEAKVEEITNINTELQEKLIQFHKNLSKAIALNSLPQQQTGTNEVQKLSEEISVLKIENDTLKRKLEISQEEAHVQYTLNALKTLELDNLRHQILDLQAISEDKATISKLNFELISSKSSEMGLNARKAQLESEISFLQGELEKSKRDYEKMRIDIQHCRKQCDNRCKLYIDIIDFLQSQYAGSTSISALERFASLTDKLRKDRADLQSELKKAKECSTRVLCQQETLNNRLQIVERLKDILEQQIGGANVQDMLQQYSEYSQHILNDFKQKRKITHLENELQMANNKATEYESIITIMENEMVNMQKVWCQHQDQQKRIDTQMSERMSVQTDTKSVSSQTYVEVQFVEVQTDPYDYSSSIKDITKTITEEIVDDKKSPLEDPVRDIAETIPEKFYKETEKPIREESEIEKIDNSIVVLNEQLSGALKLAGERSAVILRLESQLTEYQAKIDKLQKELEHKESQLLQKERTLEEIKMQSYSAVTTSGDNLALKSTINSLQKLVAQKEETIARYQNLLKEEREDHNRAISELQEETKNLKDRISMTEANVTNKSVKTKDLPMVPEKLTSPEEKEEKSDPIEIAMKVEEIARIKEKMSTLEADLHSTKELSGRWHRLAEERLNHTDRMRKRLEEEHNAELESYRAELSKWQSEADSLRQRLSENRLFLTKGNNSLVKELQEKDDKIHELTLTCQQLQNEIELLGTTNRSQSQAILQRDDFKLHEIIHTVSRDQVQQQGQTDPVRKQLQSLMEKEKLYKHEIADLKEKLSRRYMTIKTQEKKTVQREIQLERKVKLLEEELQKTRAQLDREYLAVEAKKAKTAEELSLWEKQKKWQQTAEKLQEKLKEKTNECNKLKANCEKMRSLISCMEREKWYLKSRLKDDGSNIAINFPARPISAAHQNLVEDLQKECETLRERVKELIDRLEKENTEELLAKLEEQRRRIASLEVVAKGNTCVTERLEKLEMIKDMLEKANLKLESENFELRLELEKANADAPRLREKIQHLEKYIELLKVEKSSDSTPRFFDKQLQDQTFKKSTSEMEKTIFTLKRIIEKLQVENKRLRSGTKRNHLVERGTAVEDESVLQKLYEQSQKRVVDLETDLQLAERKIAMLEKEGKDENNGDIGILKQQLTHKSELLDKVKQLLTRAAINEKSLRQRVQQLESRQTLSTIPESYVTSSPN